MKPGAVLFALIAVTLRVDAATFAFTLQPAGSAFDGTVDISAETDGTLVGDWDATGNPDGTRTKPGLLGAFGATENVPVPVQVDPSVSGPIAATPQGTFTLEWDTAAGTVILSNLTLDLLGGSTLTLANEVTLNYSSFRTRTPDSLYIGGVAIPLPLGSNTVSALAAAQVGAASSGALTPAGPGLFDFAIPSLVAVSGDFGSTLGGLTLPPTPIPVAFQGRLDLTGAAPVVTASTGIDLSNQQPLGTALPQFPLPLPTILPTGGTANLLFDLTLTDVSTTLTTSLELTATGVPVPEPTAPALLALAALCRPRRRLER